ncbi:unnamed protein product [Closterium sp. NIES-53]
MDSLAPVPTCSSPPVLNPAPLLSPPPLLLCFHPLSSHPLSPHSDPSQVGLQILLAASSSSIVIRAAKYNARPLSGVPTIRVSTVISPPDPSPSPVRWAFRFSWQPAHHPLSSEPPSTMLAPSVACLPYAFLLPSLLPTRPLPPSGGPSDSPGSQLIIHRHPSCQVRPSPHPALNLVSRFPPLLSSPSLTPFAGGTSDSTGGQLIIHRHPSLLPSSPPFRSPFCLLPPSPPCRLAFRFSWQPAHHHSSSEPPSATLAFCAALSPLTPHQVGLQILLAASSSSMVIRASCALLSSLPLPFLPPPSLSPFRWAFRFSWPPAHHPSSSEPPSTMLAPSVACLPYAFLPSSLLPTRPLPLQVGLQILLAASSSSIVIRAANLVVGVGFPVFRSFKAIEEGSQADRNRCLAFWSVYGCFRVVETITDRIISWLPFYQHIKLLLLLWLQLPSTSSSRPATGAGRLYASHLRPVLLRYRRHIDGALISIDRYMASWFHAHQEELSAAARMAQSATRAALAALDSAVSPAAEPVPPAAADDSPAATSAGDADTRNDVSRANRDGGELHDVADGGESGEEGNGGGGSGMGGGRSIQRLGTLLCFERIIRVPPFSISLPFPFDSPRPPASHPAITSRPTLAGGNLSADTQPPTQNRPTLAGEHTASRQCAPALRLAAPRSMEGSNQRSPEQREPRGSPFRAGATWIHAGATREPTGGARGQYSAGCSSPFDLSRRRLERRVSLVRAMAPRTGAPSSPLGSNAGSSPSLPCCQACCGAEPDMLPSLPWCGRPSSPVTPDVSPHSGVIFITTIIITCE